MWPFDKKPTEKRPGARGDTNMMSPEVDRLAKLEADLEKLGRKVTAIEMEWNEWFDKFRRLYARIAKRQEREDASEVETSRQDDPGRSIGQSDVSPYPPAPTARRNY